MGLSISFPSCSVESANAMTLLDKYRVAVIVAGLQLYCVVDPLQSCVQKLTQSHIPELFASELTFKLEHTHTHINSWDRICQREKKNQQ